MTTEAQSSRLYDHLLLAIFLGSTSVISMLCTPSEFTLLAWSSASVQGASILGRVAALMRRRTSLTGSAARGARSHWAAKSHAYGGCTRRLHFLVEVAGAGRKCGMQVFGHGEEKVLMMSMDVLASNRAVQLMISYVPATCLNAVNTSRTHLVSDPCHGPERARGLRFDDSCLPMQFKPIAYTLTLSHRPTDVRAQRLPIQAPTLRAQIQGGTLFMQIALLIHVGSSGDASLRSSDFDSGCMSTL